MDGRVKPAYDERKLDCSAEFIIGRRFAPTRWLAMTIEPIPVH
jgi:hypothetical protein